MAENTVTAWSATDHLKFKEKITGVPAKRPALSAINGNINPKCNNSSKLNYNFRNQPARSSKLQVLGVQKIKIYEDKNEEPSEDKENDCSSASEITRCKSSAPVKLFELLEVSKEFSKQHEKESQETGANIHVLWCTPYKDDIYSYFRSIENNFRPNAKYIDKQADITMNMRSVLVDWLVEVGEEYKLHVETLHLAVSYVDRFLSHMSVLRGKLQLVGTASMFLASKYEEIYPPDLKDFVYITDDTYTKKQILRMEHLILKVLKFDISVPTTYSFLQLFCFMFGASESVINLSQYICELSLLDSDPFLQFSPSLLAAGCLALANYTLGLHMWVWLCICYSTS